MLVEMTAKSATTMAKMSDVYTVGSKVDNLVVTKAALTVDKRVDEMAVGLVERKVESWRAFMSVDLSLLS